MSLLRAAVSLMIPPLRRLNGEADERGLADRRFVVLGDGRLVTSVTGLLERRGAAVQRIPVTETARDALGKALEKRTSCVLALDDHHEENLRAALVVSESNAQAARQVPVVVRAFDPALADEIERKRPDVPFRVRGAYSVAHLAAPDFVVAALVDKGEENLVTLRLGDEYVNVCRLRVRGAAGGPRKSRRPLAGRTPAELLKRHGCQVLARRPPDGDWSGAGEAPLELDEEVLIGGQLLDVLRLVRRHSAGGPAAPPPRPARLSRRKRDIARSAWWSLRRTAAHAGTRSAQVLAILFILVTAAAWFAPVEGTSNRFYLWVLTALGSPAPDKVNEQLSPVLSAVGLLAGGVALGLGVSLMSAYFIERRTVETTYRRARRLRHHVVIVGLGDVGLRIAQLLQRLSVDCAVVDTSTSSESARRRTQADMVPVISADLEAGLPAARIDRAFSLIATSDDNLLNVEACLRAKRATNEHVRTVARIFDDVAPGFGVGTFGVDDQISAAAVAAPAFVDAALHEECRRSIAFDGWPMAALRWPTGHPVGAGQMTSWQADGVRLLAVWRRGEGAGRPVPDAPGIHEEQAAILVGPEPAMAQVLQDLRSRTARGS